MRYRISYFERGSGLRIVVSGSGTERHGDWGQRLAGFDAKVFDGDVAPAELPAKVLDGGGVQLGNAGLGQVEGLGDVFEGELIPIVQGEDLAFHVG
jgi:hypothetical protein